MWLLGGPGNFGMHWGEKGEKGKGRGLFARGGGGFSGGNAVRSSASTGITFQKLRIIALVIFRTVLSKKGHSIMLFFVRGGNKCESALLHTERQSV